MAKTPSSKTPRTSLVVDPEREHRVRERAYYLWELEGKPHGHDVQYWERARELVAVEESAGGEPETAAAAEKPASRKASAKSPEGGDAAEEKAERMTDGGKDKEAPSAKRKSRAKPKKT